MDMIMAENPPPFNAANSKAFSCTSQVLLQDAGIAALRSKCRTATGIELLRSVDSVFAKRVCLGSSADEFDGYVQLFFVCDDKYPAVARTDLHAMHHDHGVEDLTEVVIV